MRYEELSPIWQRVFSLAWESLKRGSKAIAAVITNENGEIISEGRNRIAEDYRLNALVAHAENEAVMNLDVRKYPNLHSYVLYAGLEPCIMCMGTLVMGHIRHVVIAARDGHGGAVELLDKNEFLKSKNIEITYAEPILGSVQRCLQAIREYAFNGDERSRGKTLQAIALLNPESVSVAEALVVSGYIENALKNGTEFSEIFNEVARRLEKSVE